MKTLQRICLLAALLVITVSPLIAEEMVEITVEVTEINDNKARELGIKWTDTIATGEVAWNEASRVPALLPEVPSIIHVGDWARYSALMAELRVLEDKGAAQVLSKPRIVTRSGTSARVVIGGEIPIVATGVTGGTVHWKEYGIMAEILPQVLKDDIIDLKLTTEVSRLDWANQSNGYPAIMKREANSSLKIKSGHTFALAGLIETKKEEKKAGIPLLADIPLLGLLFSRQQQVDSKTNIVIFVTPRIVD